jgi:hypothetical protein
MKTMVWGFYGFKEYLEGETKKIKFFVSGGQGLSQWVSGQ